MTSIEENNHFHIERFKHTLPDKSYIAGFIDGDGNLFIRKLMKSVTGYQSGISISQSRTNILQVMMYHFGGSITSSTNRNCIIKSIVNEDGLYDKSNIRNEYNYIIRSNEYDRLLNYIYNVFVVKHKQMELLWKFKNVANIPHKNDVREELYKECVALNKAKYEREIKEENINDAYIAGLLDSEGYIGIQNKKPIITICQKTNIKLLNHIIQYLQYGKIVKYCIYIVNSENILNFIERIKSFVIVKYNQVIALEKYIHNEYSHEESYKILNREKHEVEYFTSLNVPNTIKTGYMEYCITKENYLKVVSQLKIRQQYINKSIKMKTEQNHIYSAPKSEITKKRMSVAMSLKKRTITDEQILQVRGLLNSHKNIEIEKITGLRRDQVSKIRNGELCLTTELEESNKPQKRTKEEVAIMKRKILLEEIIQIFKYLIEGKNYNEIILQVENATVDICKNMKAKMRKGILPFYKCEMREEDYEMYEKMLVEWG